MAIDENNPVNFHYHLTYDDMVIINSALLNFRQSLMSNATTYHQCSRLIDVMRSDMMKYRKALEYEIAHTVLPDAPPSISH